MTIQGASLPELDGNLDFMVLKLTKQCRGDSAMHADGV